MTPSFDQLEAHHKQIDLAEQAQVICPLPAEASAIFSLNLCNSLDRADAVIE
jgi:hypothetical protein